MATTLELRRHLGTLASILWNYGAAFPVPTLNPYEDGAFGFELRAVLPGPGVADPAEIVLAEAWEPVGQDDYRLTEYAYDFIERPLDRRLAFHRHDEEAFLRAFAVAVHEHCEERLGRPACDHYLGLPVDAYEAVRRFTVLWGQPGRLGCDDRRCIG